MTRSYDTLWRFLFWTITALFPLPLLISLVGLDLSAWADHWAVLMGVVAYAWWLFAILLSVRPQWLDRAVGLPSIYAVHGLLGVAALGSAYIHKDNSGTSIRLAEQLGDWGFYLALALVCYSMFFMSGWLTDRSPVIAGIKATIERVIPHSVAVWVHRLNLVVVAMIWMHTHLFPFLVEIKAFIITFNVMTVGTLGIYAWKKWIAPRHYTTGIVTANTPLNTRTRQVQITLDPATTSRLSRQPQPGDFYFLQFQGKGLNREWHPFSLTDANQQVATFTIRQIGDFTHGISSVNTGTPVRLEGPFGLFNTLVNDSPPDHPLVLIGLGAGIAPMLSLVDGHVANRPITVIWGISTPEDAYYADSLANYQTKNPDRFQYTIHHGRLTQSVLAEIIEPELVANGVFFVVGPNPAVLAIQRSLRLIGVAGSQVHHERMTF